MTDKLEINGTHLLVLKKNDHDKSVLIDYLLLSNPMRKLLDRAYKKCRDEQFHKEYPNEILQADSELRSIFLKNYDFCPLLHRPYQDVPYLSNLDFEYDSELEQIKIEEEVKKDKNELLEDLQIRDLAYSLEIAYKKAMDDHNVIAMSHRRRGWTEEPFELTKKLKIQFKTNFGYGSKSYFYAKLIFKDIDIIPFSEWVRYKDTTYNEILKYSQRYEVENKSWKNAMEYVRDASNLCVKDEVNFIKTFVITECQWLIKGLNGVCDIENPNDKFLSEIANKRDGMDYKGEKLSGSLNFITSIAEFESITSVSNFINELEQLCEDELPSLIKEYKANSMELKREERNLEIEEPLFHQLQFDSNEISRVFIPLKKKYKRIEALYERILICQAKNLKCGKKLIDLFNIKYHDYKEIQNNYKKIKPKYEEIQAKYLESQIRYEKFRKLIRRFKTYKRDFESYIEKIDNHLLTYRQNYKSIGSLEN